MIPFPIIDTHVHFWDPAHLRYAWLDGNETLNRPYLPADYTQATEGVAVDGIVFVQAECASEQYFSEAEWVDGLTNEDSRIQGIVASAHLELGDAVLPALEALSQYDRVKGIRRYVAGQRDAEYILRPDFVQGVQHLARVNFACDLGTGRHQLADAIALARRCPEVRFMLCHIGVPDIRNQELDPWRSHIETLASLPNVFCKLSGVATLADKDNWTREDLRPAIEHILNCFGFERTAFGSDWPVMVLATTFRRWVETVAWVVQDCSESELRHLFRDTAKKVYNLDPPSTR
jgi:L-fuconolactonase